MTCNNKLNKHRKLKTFESQGRLHSSKPATDAAFGNLSCVLRKTDLIKPWWNPQFFLPESSSQAYQRGDRSAVLMLVLHKQPGQIRIRLERLSQWLVPKKTDGTNQNNLKPLELSQLCFTIAVGQVMTSLSQSDVPGLVSWWHIAFVAKIRSIFQNNVNVTGSMQTSSQNTGWQISWNFKTMLNASSRHFIEDKTDHFAVLGWSSSESATVVTSFLS